MRRSSSQRSDITGDGCRPGHVRRAPAYAGTLSQLNSYGRYLNGDMEGVTTPLTIFWLRGIPQQKSWRNWERGKVPPDA